MKRLICLAMLLVAGLGAATAQNYVVVDSEKIFKSLTEYNAALSELDALAAREQKNVDAKFAQVETLYNNYMQVKNSLSAVSQQARENQILATREGGAGVSGVGVRQRGHPDEETAGADPAHPEAGVRRYRGVCRTAGCRSGAGLRLEPDDALPLRRGRQDRGDHP